MSHHEQLQQQHQQKQQALGRWEFWIVAVPRPPPVPVSAEVSLRPPPMVSSAPCSAGIGPVYCTEKYSVIPESIMVKPFSELNVEEIKVYVFLLKNQHVHLHTDCFRSVKSVFTTTLALVCVFGGHGLLPPAAGNGLRSRT